MIVMLWRGGLRVQEALTLREHALTRDAARCSCTAARAGAGGRSAWTDGAALQRGSRWLLRASSRALSSARSSVRVEAPKW